MRNFRVLVLALLVLSCFGCVSAFGQVIDPNVGFCTAGLQCGGGDPNTIPNQKSFGMYSFGSNDANTPWYLLVSVPEFTGVSASQPTITSTSFPGLGFVTKYTLNPAPPNENIYDLTNPTTGYTGDSSMSNVNMFPLVKGAVDFAVFVFVDNAEGFKGNTQYTFSVADPGLPFGTFLAAVAVGGNKGQIQFSTPFTTAGFISVPDGGVTLMLLGGVLVGLETVRRRFRV